MKKSMMTILTLVAILLASPSTSFATSPQQPENQMIYYYNNNGGSFYHTSPECETVNEKFLPMVAIQWKDLQTLPLSKLRPCKICINESILTHMTGESSQSSLDQWLLDYKPLVPEKIIEPIEGDLSAAEALRIAKWQIADLDNHTEDQIDRSSFKACFVLLRIYGVDTKVWIVTFFPDNNQDIVSTVAIQSPTEKVLHRESSFFWEFSKAWEEWGGSYYEFWTAEEKALYHTVYQLYPTRLMPEPDSIPQEKAQQIAAEAIQKEFNLSDEKLASYAVDYNYVPSWYAHQHDNSWIIIYRSSMKTNLYQVVLSAVDGTVYTCSRNNDNDPSVYE